MKDWTQQQQRFQRDHVSTRLGNNEVAEQAKQASELILSMSGLSSSVV